MPATTAKLALPYPVAADTADVPRDIKALADRLDIVGSGAIVSALPGSPADGQEVYYLASATAGIVWHLRYRAASASAHKWEMIGGPPLTGEAAAQVTTSSPTFVDLGPPYAEVTVPLAGEYVIGHGARAAQTSGTNQIVIATVKLGAVAAGDGESAVNLGGNGVPDTSIARSMMRALTAGAVVRQQYRTGGGAQFSNRWVQAEPVRVS